MAKLPSVADRQWVVKEFQWFWPYTTSHSDVFAPKLCLVFSFWNSKFGVFIEIPSLEWINPFVSQNLNVRAKWNKIKIRGIPKKMNHQNIPRQKYHFTWENWRNITASFDQVKHILPWQQLLFFRGTTKSNYQRIIWKMVLFWLPHKNNDYFQQ